MCTDLSDSDCAAPPQNSMAPSLPSLLCFSDTLLRVRWSRSISAMAPAAALSMEQWSIVSVWRWANRAAALTTVSAPSDPISLFERLSISSLVVSSCCTAAQPGARRPMVSATRTLKGLNCLMPAVSISKPRSPMFALCETSSEVTPETSAWPMVSAFVTMALSLEGVGTSSSPQMESASTGSTSLVGSQVFASSRAVSASSSLARRMSTETWRVKRGRSFQCRACTSAVMLLMSMPFSERLMPSHSLPSTTRKRTSFFEKLLRSFSIFW
mmetsp:Transcript_107506/g.346910  ORF Transcript_107506/g.346910 Transcript_107506/m.346910 type:complete len:270 (+) Transcript_107506:910-1719(+)